MKPAAFDYIRADSAEETIGLLARYGDDAKILAGGQSLMAMLNIRLAQPAMLVDISRCADLDYVRVDKGQLVVGAAATQASVETRATLAAEVPLLDLALPWISHFQIRNRGTVCGSVAHADPSAELPLCLTALQGEVVLRSKAGRRVLKADEFFQGMLMTAVRPGEIVEEVRFPLRQPGARYAFEEVSMRHGDFAIVALAAVVTDAAIELTVGGVADRPQRRRWTRLQGADLDAAINDFAWELDAESDAHASAQYRRHLVRHLGRQLIAKASA
ncbi:MAG: carbon monoxide dehydrogenase [Massilia sp.]|jgi:2-furoyl-CoA dehydrogenase FAD binding subunit|nr:carbon monoxide dehydrogenase [Massilia sp.]MDB5949288.1 carbon monoxide dehydrogenase [Massilia sp.]